MDTKLTMILTVLLAVGIAGAKEEPAARETPKELLPTITDVKTLLPIGDGNWKTGIRALGMLEKITDPALARMKVPLLVGIYKSQNTATQDAIKDLPGPTRPERRVQIQALGQLGGISTNDCAAEVLAILQDYLDFMNTRKGPFMSRPRWQLQLSMAKLFDVHIDDAKIRDLGPAYLESSALHEMTKGRIATTLLRYRVGRITDKSDPSLFERLALIMDTACLASLDETLRAPKRIYRSTEILREITEERPEKLVAFINNRTGQLSDSAKYFFACASLNGALQKIHAKPAKPLLGADIQLTESAMLWYMELQGKIENVKDRSTILESLVKAWNEVR